MHNGTHSGIICYLADPFFCVYICICTSIYDTVNCLVCNHKTGKGMVNVGGRRERAMVGGEKGNRKGTTPIKLFHDGIEDARWRSVGTLMS